MFEIKCEYYWTNTRRIKFSFILYSGQWFKCQCECDINIDRCERGTLAHNQPRLYLPNNEQLVSLKWRNIMAKRVLSPIILKLNHNYSSIRPKLQHIQNKNLHTEVSHTVWYIFIVWLIKLIPPEIWRSLKLFEYILT